VIRHSPWRSRSGSRQGRSTEALEAYGGCIQAGDLPPYVLFFLARRAEGCQKVSLAAQLRSLGKYIGARRSSALLSAAALLAPSFDLACHGALPLPP
jgi:hypothetical protein